VLPGLLQEVQLVQLLDGRLAETLATCLLLLLLLLSAQRHLPVLLQPQRVA
jgi:hypothetical protein